MSFQQDYWDANYAEPKTMDGIGNAREHLRYLKSFFKLELIDISSIIDLGFGHGVFFQKLLKEFVPYKAMGIEPSKFIFEKANIDKWRPVPTTDLSLYNEDLQRWCSRRDLKKYQFDLGICMSVLQYIPTKDLTQIIEVLSKRVKYLYLTVPTDKELKRQVEELDFKDKYAIKRSRSFYRKLLAPHFTNISSKLWESKYFFDEESTLFTDLLYRS